MYRHEGSWTLLELRSERVRFLGMVYWALLFYRSVAVFRCNVALQYIHLRSSLRRRRWEFYLKSIYIRASDAGMEMIIAVRAEFQWFVPERCNGAPTGQVAQGDTEYSAAHWWLLNVYTRLRIAKSGRNSDLMRSRCTEYATKSKTSVLSILQCGL